MATGEWLSADRVRRSDLPILGCVAVRLAPRNAATIFLGTVLLAAIQSWLPALAISYLFYRHGRFTRILDHEELPIVLSMGVLAIPALVVAYLRMPSLVADTFNGLERNGVFRCSDWNESLVSRFVSKAGEWLSKRVWYFFSLAVVLAGAVWWQARVVGAPGMENCWWHTNTWYYLLVWLPVLLFYYYLVAVTTCRGVVGAIALGLLLWRFETVFQPMHRDGWGGFAPLGRFFRIVALALSIAALSGVALWLNSFLRASGESTVIPLIFSAVYVVVAPAILFFPLLSARRAMRKAAERELAQIGDQYQEVTRRIGDPLAPSSTTAVLPLLHYQANLLQWRELTVSRLGAWPIGLPTAALTALSVFGWIVGTASSIVTLLGLA